MKKSIFLVLTIILCVGFITAQTEICVDFDNPSAPSSLSVTSSGTNIILIWGAATDTPSCSGVAYYVIVRNGNITLGNTTSLTYTDVNVPYGTYFYSVYAVDKVAHLGGQAIKNNVVLSAPSNGGGGFGGGGGGNTIVSGGNSINSYICSENWQCGGWSECVTPGTQTRTCTDLNSCGTTLNKPATSQECALESQTSSTDFLTGAVTGITNFVKTGGGTVTFIGLIIVIVLLITLFSVRKNKFNNN